MTEVTDARLPRWPDKAVRDWYRENGWRVFGFQKDTWSAWQWGQSGLIHSPTGSGKTLAAWLGPVQHARSLQRLGLREPAGLKVLWITPLRALATDTSEQLQQAAVAVACDWRVETRTGDTSAAMRARQRKKPPDALVTTPESLSVLLSYADNEHFFRSVHTIVVDEWHELLGSKRGVLLELCLARLKTLNTGQLELKQDRPTADREQLRIWGISATLANLDEACDVLLGRDSHGQALSSFIVRGRQARKIDVTIVDPPADVPIPWAGHLGLRLVDEVISAVEQHHSTLLFTNTRSQAELWFEALTHKRLDWLGTIALHHGSVDRKLRREIENRLREGTLRCVVCTSSLDLGVDFSPVDLVIQVGSPKGVSRLVQRAGRSGHQPDKSSRVLCVPTHALEVVEFAATRDAIKRGEVEAREPLERSLDVLVQHLVTTALGSGFIPGKLLPEIRSTFAFRNLTNHEWEWALDFIMRGGKALQAYEHYNRVQEVNGILRVPSARIARMHRMSIGTIGGDSTMRIRWLSGGNLGVIEEAFISRLDKGTTFLFAGRLVELVMVRDMTAYVRKSKQRSRSVPRWQGGRMALSARLSHGVLELLASWRDKPGSVRGLKSIDHLLRLQLLWSHLPGNEDFLIECVRLREGYSYYFYPFAGRLVNEGLATLVAWRLMQRQPITFSLSSNDYGFELLSKDQLQLDEALIREVFCGKNLVEDLISCMNTSEIAKRQFRDIARIAGLVFQGYPGSGKSTRQIQASSSLIFDVLEDYDSDNLLLDQARREILDQQLEIVRMRETLNTLAARRIYLQHTQRLTPLAFPLWADRLQSQVMSSENWRQRVEKMLAQLGKAAGESRSDSSQGRRVQKNLPGDSNLLNE